MQTDGILPLTRLVAVFRVTACRVDCKEVFIQANGLEHAGDVRIRCFNGEDSDGTSE